MHLDIVLQRGQLAEHLGLVGASESMPLRTVSVCFADRSRIQCAVAYSHSDQQVRGAPQVGPGGELYRDASSGRQPTGADCRATSLGDLPSSLRGGSPTHLDNRAARTVLHADALSGNKSTHLVGGGSLFSTTQLQTLCHRRERRCRGLNHRIASSLNVLIFLMT